MSKIIFTTQRDVLLHLALKITFLMAYDKLTLTYPRVGAVVGDAPGLEDILRYIKLNR